jgi:hypothetical protein
MFKNLILTGYPSLDRRARVPWANDYGCVACYLWLEPVA